jgi:hypothetical protein
VSHRPLAPPRDDGLNSTGKDRLVERVTGSPLLWCLAACLVLTGLVWILGQRLAGVELAPDRGASWYYWQLPHPSAWTRLSAWTGYALHQLSAWALIYYAQQHVRRYVKGLHPINVIALAVNLIFILLHVLQSQLFYDGLAQDVSIYSSQGSVILLLVVVLLMESRRRGLILGRGTSMSKRVVDFVRRYHGYLFSWAVIYTFWYHPIVNTPGHLVGFFYMFLLLVQGSLFFTRAHVNRWWTVTLELMVAVHGALVAIMTSGPQGMWPMFLFGFLAIFVLTQMHGLGLSARIRTIIGAAYIAAVAAVYSWRGWSRLQEITWIPVIEYGLVAVLAGLIAASLWIARTIPDRPTQRKAFESVGSQGRNDRR